MREYKNILCPLTRCRQWHLLNFPRERNWPARMDARLEPWAAARRADWSADRIVGGPRMEMVHPAHPPRWPPRSPPRPADRAPSPGPPLRPAMA
jgi:hypothetical protein